MHSFQCDDFLKASYESTAKYLQWNIWMSVIKEMSERNIRTGKSYKEFIKTKGKVMICERNVVVLFILARNFVLTVGWQF